MQACFSGVDCPNFSGIMFFLITKIFLFFFLLKHGSRPIVFPGSLAVLKSCGEAAPNSRGVPRRLWRRKRFGLIQKYSTTKEIASFGSPPRFARRPVCIEFSGQKRIGDFLKHGSSRLFSEMLSFRKDYSPQSISRLDLRILRTHEPVRAK